MPKALAVTAKLCQWLTARYHSQPGLEPDLPLVRG
jgi:hypothetical protein